MASLLKPQPPPRAPAGPSTGRGKATGGYAAPGAFDLLMRELEANGNAGLHRGRSNSRSRQPVSARVPSASRRNSNGALGDVTNRQPSQHRPKPPAAAAAAPHTARNQPSAAANLTPRDPAPTTTTTTSTTPRASDGGSGGMSWQDAVGQYASQLTAFEAREIQNFPKVYYCGQRCTRKVHAMELSGTNNHGFDDAQGDYKVVMEDHIAFRYQLLAPLGRGSFGQVSKALDHKTGQHVALKIIKNKKKFHEQALVEVKVLKHLNGKDADGASNVVRMLSHFKFRNHMVIAFELHGQSLYDLHKAHRFAPMTLSAIRNFGRQMLQTLVLTHREHVVHCDLKPENVLLVQGSKSRLSVIDFGSACFDSERLYTYIQSRFYRAPEVLLGIPYTPQIDVWSLGCMLAEFSNGYPLFAGESENQQMLLIMETFGLPPRSMLDRAPRKRIFFDASGTPKLVPNSRGRTPRPNTKSLAAFVQCTDPDFLDLLKGLLTYEPERRLTPSEALRHPFFASSSSTAAVASAGAAEPLLPRLQPSKRR